MSDSTKPPRAVASLRRIALSVVAFGIIGSIAQSCSIPVFRYALERWRPDPFEVLIFHRGALTIDQQGLALQLSPEYVPGEAIPNVAVTTIDLDGTIRPGFVAIWQTDFGEPLPWMLVRTPWRGENHTVWEGPLTRDAVQAVLQSPVRVELMKRLAGGESVVWVLVDGTDAAENARLEAAVRQQLQGLQGGIQLPEILHEDLSELSVSPEQLGLRFSVLRLRRDDPRESLLVRTLLTAKPGLDAPELAGEPMLFPIFGRCRAYFPLVGSSIEPLQIEDLARFLSGACQCTIKQQNPGVDLLTALDWDAYVLGIETERPLPPLAGLGGFADADAGPVETPIVPVVASENPVQSAAVNAAAENLTESTGPSEAGPAPDSARAEPRSESSAGSTTVGGLVLWVGGLMAAIVAVATLWLLPRR